MKAKNKYEISATQIWPKKSNLHVLLINMSGIQLKLIINISNDVLKLPEIL